MIWSAIRERAFPLAKVLFSSTNERKALDWLQETVDHGRIHRRHVGPDALDREQIIRRPADQLEAFERHCFRSIRCLKDLLRMLNVADVLLADGIALVAVERAVERAVLGHGVDQRVNKSGVQANRHEQRLVFRVVLDLLVRHAHPPVHNLTHSLRARVHGGR